MLLVQRPPHDDHVVDGIHARLGVVAGGLRQRVGKERAHLLVGAQIERAAVDARAGEVHVHGVQAALGHHRAKVLRRRVHIVERNAGRRREAGGAAVAQLGRALHPPLDVAVRDAVLVLKEAARPQRGGLLVLVHADALALQAGRRVDAGVRPHERAGPEERARREYRQRRPVAVPLRRDDRQRRERHLGNVELLVHELAVERLRRRRRRGDEFDPFRLHRPVHHGKAAGIGRERHAERRFPHHADLLGES